MQLLKQCAIRHGACGSCTGQLRQLLVGSAFGLIECLCGCGQVIPTGGTLDLTADDFDHIEIINGNTWYGDELSVDVTAGTEGYTFMSLFRKPAHGYEFSGHFMGDGEGPQTFVVIDTVEYDGKEYGSAVSGAETLKIKADQLYIWVFKSF